MRVLIVGTNYLGLARKLAVRAKELSLESMEHIRIFPDVIPPEISNAIKNASQESINVKVSHQRVSNTFYAPIRPNSSTGHYRGIKQDF